MTGIPPRIRTEHYLPVRGRSKPTVISSMAEPMSDEITENMHRFLVHISSRRILLYCILRQEAENLKKKEDFDRIYEEETEAEVERIRTRYNLQKEDEQCK